MTDKSIELTAKEILGELKALGADSYKRVLLKHGVQEPCYGAKISDMQKIVKRVKKDYRLALALYDSGVYDAMYLAGLIADDAQMTKKDLKGWLSKANCRSLCSWTVPWVAAGSLHGWDLALEWIDSKKPNVAIAGWATLGSIVSVKPDSQLDIKTLEELIQRIEFHIHSQPDLVRYQMNAFLISLGCYVAPLTAKVLRAAKRIGPVHADLGDNDCKVPDITKYIVEKVQAKGLIGKKRKTAKC
jgi:3-methyladenine DNA glycosylase AlkD